MNKFKPGDLFKRSTDCNSPDLIMFIEDEGLEKIKVLAIRMGSHSGKIFTISKRNGWVKLLV